MRTRPDKARAHLNTKAMKVFISTSGGTSFEPPFISHTHLFPVGSASPRHPPRSDPGLRSSARGANGGLAIAHVTPR